MDTRAEGDEGDRPGLAARTGVVTAADVVAGHVRLDISCLDRVYLNGYVARLQTPGGVVWFFHEHRGKPIVSPALFEPIGEKFRREMKDWAQANGVPLIRFRAGERKARPGPQPLHPHPRRPAVRLLLHQGLRPHPAAAHGTGPAQRTPRTRRRPGHPRPAHRRAHRQGPHPHRSLTPRHGRRPTARPGHRPARQAPSTITRRHTQD